MSDQAVQPVIAFDATIRSFTFFYIDSLVPSGQAESSSYTITLTGTVSGNPLQSASSEFTLVISNPCIDPTFVSVKSTPVPEMYYKLFNADFSFQHSEFEVETLPVEHELCGPLVYKATFMDLEIDGTSAPVSYSSELRTFKMYSESMDLIGRHKVTLSACLRDFPEVKS